MSRWVFSSAAGGACWPIATSCPSLGPSPSIGGGAHRPARGRLGSLGRAPFKGGGGGPPPAPLAGGAFFFWCRKKLLAPTNWGRRRERKYLIGQRPRSKMQIWPIFEGGGGGGGAPPPQVLLKGAGVGRGWGSWIPKVQKFVYQQQPNQHFLL